MMILIIQIDKLAVCCTKIETQRALKISWNIEFKLSFKYWEINKANHYKLNLCVVYYIPKYIQL